jgi:hypothetical protein
MCTKSEFSFKYVKVKKYGGRVRREIVAEFIFQIQTNIKGKSE